MKCFVCDECGWVCENHPDRPFEGDCRVHGAMRATMIPNRRRRRASNPNSTRRAGVIESDRGEGSMTDQEVLISTLREARRIIGEYIESGPRKTDQTLTQLIAVLDRQDVAHAIERLEKGHEFRD